jgi:leucyl aminopeptidase
MSACDFLSAEADADSVPILPVRKADLPALLDGTPAAAAWVRALGFVGEPGSHCALPAADGCIERVLLGVGDEPMWDWAALPGKLAAGVYRIEAPLPADEASNAAFGWALATYRFERYRKRPRGFATLLWPDAADRDAVRRAADATFLARDLINTPASDMGPAELASAVLSVAARFDACCAVTESEELLARNYPAVHAVGRASSRAPRLIDLTWGEEDRPKVTLVGKGVCFDTGGLDLKPASAMKLMKKDMGGAAIMLGLAQMVMAANLPVRLRLLVAAVENSIAGNALRPLDVVRTRKGLTVEIGNTDAEGRVILADALAEAAMEGPALLLDCATLTGAARAALGTELPALFAHDDALAQEIQEHGQACADPMWRLPLWKPYRRHLSGKTADLTNAPDLPFAGAILAALFLAEFVDPPCPWAHLDVMAWNTDSRPGRPEGGEAMGLRALFRLIEARFPR